MRIRYSADKDGPPVKRAVVYTQDEHSINLADVDRDAIYIVERLRANGYETYIVGGAARDLILGEKPKDFDIVSEASPAKIKKVFRNSRIIGRRFRLVHVYFGAKIFEVSTFRSLKDGPTSNTFGTIEEDVLRRDFTLNALFYDPQNQTVVDYVNGMRDIREKRIRPIIPLKVIFKDDPVRMIRAVKFAASAGFKLPFTLGWKIKRDLPLLESVSPSRLTEEILKIIRAPQASKIIEALEKIGLYRYLQPRASTMMKENPLFKNRYLKGFQDLQGDDPGVPLAAMIRDFLEDFADWDAMGVTENYKSAFAAARQFVLPMNPPRTDLDRAIRLIFEEHGVTVKRSRLMERGKGLPRNPEREAGHALGETGDEAPKTPRKRPRRRRRSAKEGGKPAAAEAPEGNFPPVPRTGEKPRRPLAGV